jgi:tryptophanase
MIEQVDMVYMSARKSAMARGGLIATNHQRIFNEILPNVPVYEGFITYGGMSTKEIESIAVGMYEMVTSISLAAAQSLSDLCEPIN